MKQKLLLLSMLACSLAWNSARAGETEPNDTWNTANKLTLNGSNSGAINPAAEADWWKVTTNGDGALTLTLTAISGKPTYFDLYDTLGTIVLHSGTFTSGTASYAVDGLAQGTYYIKIHCYYATDTSSYTISNSLTVPAQANDAEPNGTRALAKTLPLNGSKTGHIDYYYNNNRDTLDWYKVTTNADGRLRLTMTSANGQNVWAYLYDNNGTTLIAGFYTAGSAVVVNADGLAAGTYYIRINTYYNYEYAPYTISDSLFSPTVPNDPEPDSTRALALTLPLNGSANGHVNYYYNIHKDSVDWYKVTTNADGRIRLTMTSGNGQNVWAYLYDNDGTTLLAGSYTSGSAVVVNKDGLAAGTYYIRVNTYYTSEWAPYTLADSLFTPAQANDIEPNDTKATALTLPVNGSKTGHTNYYYNLVKDGQDWYKLTTTSDANINIAITSHNGQNVWAYLYDNDGTTLLGSAYSTGSTNYNVDGLAAGTYYIRVNTYYTSDWAPYTLANTVTPYTNANDAEPNDAPHQAVTMQANSTVTGHVNFYYNLVKDGLDWHKINYTGSGSLTLNMAQEAHKSNGALINFWVYVYKDTLAAPVAAQYSAAATWSMNLSNLKSGYYWIRVNTYYASEYASYSITNTFTQVGPKLTASYDTVALACSSANKITIKATKSGSTTVQLYRYGVAYGSPVVTTKNAVFKNLPIGSYYATGVADGASGGMMGTSKTVNLIPMPTNPNTTAIGSAQASLNWTIVSCARYYSVQYRVHGTLPWSIKKTTGNVDNYLLTGLTNATMYDWEVAAVDTLNGIKATSIYTDSVVFTTAATPFATAAGNSSLSNKQNNGNGNGGSDLQVFPNPASSKFRLQFTGINTNGNMVATLKDINGRTVWQAANINSAVLKSGMDVNVSNLPNGIYYLQLTDVNKNEITQKVIVSR